MKAYGLDLRERVVKFVHNGGSKVEAAHRFRVGRNTVYRYLAAALRGKLAPKKSWGAWRKLDPATLAAEVKKHPDATLRELQQRLGVSHNAIWVRLGQLRLTLKKSHKISRAQRSPAVAVPARTRKTG
jgi:transposase